MLLRIGAGHAQLNDWMYKMKLSHQIVKCDAAIQTTDSRFKVQNGLFD